jgi:hypothetical protein
MTAAERAAILDLEAAERAVGRAVATLEAAHERLEVVTRRECRRERAKASASAHLRLIVGARR